MNRYGEDYTVAKIEILNKIDNPEKEKKKLDNKSKKAIKK
jgi:hypothetical protein